MSAPGRHTEVAKSAAQMPYRQPTTPWGCTRLFELRHLVSEAVPAQVSRYAASPLRSDLLASDSGLSQKHRPSCELTRPVPSTLWRCSCLGRRTLFTEPRSSSGRRG